MKTKARRSLPDSVAAASVASSSLFLSSPRSNRRSELDHSGNWPVDTGGTPEAPEADVPGKSAPVLKRTESSSRGAASMLSGFLISSSGMGERSSAASKATRSLRSEKALELDEPMLRRTGAVLRMMVPGCVRGLIEDGNLDFINEIRPLTCLYLGFPSLLEEGRWRRSSLSPSEGMGSLARSSSYDLAALHQSRVDGVQFVVQQSQEVMRRWGGSCLQFRCDEKGFVGVCVFGLPGHTHEDNPGRGVQAAMDLLSRFEKGGQRVCVGITTDELMCTCVGARRARLEYTVGGSHRPYSSAPFGFD